MSQAVLGWENFQTDRMTTGVFPRWPNEAMLKVLFGRYLSDNRIPQAGEYVLDIGCGFGQNLLPFINRGCHAAGVELTESMVNDARRAMGSHGAIIDFRVGRNTAIPFEDESFDWVVSVNTIHYEQDEGGYIAAIREFARVLKEQGRCYISTVAPRHEIRRRAAHVSGHTYKIQNYDFRDGETMFFLDDEEELTRYLTASFSAVETGRITEDLMTRVLDFFIALAAKA